MRKEKEWEWVQEESLSVGGLTILKTAHVMYIYNIAEPSNMSLVVYRLVHPPVTRESGVRLPAEEDTFFSALHQVDEGLPVDARSDLL